MCFIGLIYQNSPAAFTHTSYIYRYRNASVNINHRIDTKALLKILQSSNMFHQANVINKNKTRYRDTVMLILYFVYYYIYIYTYDQHMFQG